MVKVGMKYTIEFTHWESSVCNISFFVLLCLSFKFLLYFDGIYHSLIKKNLKFVQSNNKLSIRTFNFVGKSNRQKKIVLQLVIMHTRSTPYNLS